MNIAGITRNTAVWCDAELAGPAHSQLETVFLRRDCEKRAEQDGLAHFANINQAFNSCIVL
jgi:hypothetical protein